MSGTLEVLLRSTPFPNSLAYTASAPALVKVGTTIVDG
jgi:hypothetical protein